MHQPQWHLSQSKTRNLNFTLSLNSRSQTPACWIHYSAHNLKSKSNTFPTHNYKTWTYKIVYDLQQKFGEKLTLSLKLSGKLCLFGKKEIRCWKRQEGNKIIFKFYINIWYSFSVLVYTNFSADINSLFSLSGFYYIYIHHTTYSLNYFIFAHSLLPFTDYIQSLFYLLLHHFHSVSSSFFLNNFSHFPFYLLKYNPVFDQ